MGIENSFGKQQEVPKTEEKEIEQHANDRSLTRENESGEVLLALTSRNMADRSLIKDRVDELRKAKQDIGFVDNTIEPLLLHWSK